MRFTWTLIAWKHGVYIYLVTLEESLVSALKQIHFREVEPRVRVAVYVTVLCTEVTVQLWTTLWGELAVEDEHVVHARWRHCFVDECLDLRLGVKIDSALYVASLELIRVSAVYYGHPVNGTVVFSVDDVRHLNKNYFKNYFMLLETIFYVF